ncbi:MAG: helix-turn-helix domain-containing protein [Actinomycetota bacterium]
MESEELPLLYKVSKAAELLGISRTNVYYLMDEGRIRSVRIGKRRLIPRDALASFVRELEAAS